MITQTPNRWFARTLATVFCLSFSVMIAVTHASALETDDSTSGRHAQKSKHERIAKSRKKDPNFEFTAPRNPLALVVRDLSEKSQRSMVLMNGMEITAQAGPYDSKKLSVMQWVDRIAEDAGARVEHTPSYDFIYPAGYEVLNEGTIATRLDPGLAERRTSLNFDLDTPLFSALALLSHSLRTAIVADNIVGDARCGETHLFDVTLAEALDALLRSARIANRAFNVKSTANSVFLYSPARPLREKALVQMPGEVLPNWIDRRVTLYLPAAPEQPEHLRGYARSVPLAESLAEMGKQTGLHFEADTRMHTLPVNPTVMVDVPLRTALELIVNQWPLPQFGYRVNGDTVRFVYLGQPLEK